jgi:DNA-binding phage protein
VRTLTEQKTAGEKARAYDAVEFLESDEDVVAYLNAALEDGDPSHVSAALGDVARARGMGKSRGCVMGKRPSAQSSTQQ